ncbi:apolipoprotein D-like [Arctopsyche grandis]|uniref:apolipoprotein D-like n=1 Tax=Arctopsyche grandis TaxID=121162 RepID=UPI00406D9FDB
MMKSLWFLFGFAVAIQAQVAMIGKCPDLPVITDFDASSYTGKWYEYAKYFAVFELNGKCITATYTAVSGGVAVLNEQIDIKTNQPSSIGGTANFTEDPSVAKLSVVFPSIPFGRPAPYWVLDTDYDNYAVVFSCTEFLFFHTEIVWILTRSPVPDQEIVDQAYGVMTENGLKTSLLIPTDLSCFNVPT